MKKIFLIAFAGLLQPVLAQEVIREWNFNDNLKTSKESTDSVRVVGELSYSLKPSTTGSKNIVLHTTSYPAKDQKNQSQGIEFVTTTKGFSNIQLTTTLKFSTTAPNTWVVQACLHPEALSPEWQNIDTLDVIAKAGSNIQTLSDFSGNSSLNDKDKIAFRLVASFAVGSTQYVPVSAALYSTRGTVQFDNIILKGIQRVEPSCAESEITASGISIKNQTGYAGVLHWEKGDGDSALVVISSSEVLSKLPENGKSYSSSTFVGNELAKNGNSTILSTHDCDSAVIHNLRPGKKYYVFIYEVFCSPVKYSLTPSKFSFTTPVSDQHPELYFNELMADNSVTIKDDRGLYKDWIELYSPNSFSIDLAGYFISNDAKNLTKCMLREDVSHRKKNNGYYTMLWADGTTTQSCQHLNFELQKEGGMLYLTAPDSITIIDSIIYPALEKDEAYQRNGDANDSWVKTKTATPLDANVSKTVGIQNIEIESIDIWPNPIKRGEIMNFKTVQDYELYTNTGILVCRNDKSKQFNTSNLHVGLYYLKFHNGLVHKIIVL